MLVRSGRVGAGREGSRWEWPRGRDRGGGMEGLVIQTLERGRLGPGQGRREERVEVGGLQTWVEPWTEPGPQARGLTRSWKEASGRKERFQRGGPWDWGGSGSRDPTK